MVISRVVVWLHGRAILVCACGMLMLLVAFTAVSEQALVEHNAVQSADAIVVIGGDHKPERMRRAVELFQQGYAPIVIISAGTLVMEGIESIPEAEVMRRQATDLGLPADAMIIESNSKSTYENALFTKPILDQRDARKILLVTSVFHSRRAKRIFDDVFGSSTIISIQPALQDEWMLLWTFRPDDIYVVFYEYQNWVRYWFGLR